MKPVFKIKLKKGQKVKVLMEADTILDGVVTSVVQPEINIYSDIDLQGSVYVKIGEDVHCFPPSLIAVES